MRATAIDPEHPADGGTIWTAEDVTRQREAEAALARARDEAEAANRAKSAFLANTSHEIRTPLNGLVGLARLAREPGVEPARLQQYLAQIRRQRRDAVGHHLRHPRPVQDRGRQARARVGALRPYALLQSLEQAYRALADSRAPGFEVTIDPRLPPWVRGDALRVRQILANFLHNALKFTHRGGVRLVAGSCPATAPASRCTTPAWASMRPRRRGCSNPSPRPMSPSPDASVALAWGCRSAASWPN
jgi:signal transduction histidine kinase